MCSVIGYIPPIEGAERTDCDLDLPPLRQAFKALMLEARIRGTHAFGIAQLGYIHRDTRGVDSIINEFNPQLPAVAHARYSTSGDWRTLDNNQPIQVGHTVLAFNGVIDMGTKDEFEKRWDVTCESDNDGEIFVRRMRSGQSPTRFVREMSGSFAGVWMEYRTNEIQIWALRNERRPLWSSTHLGATWYASTKDMFKRAGFSGRFDEVEPFMEELTTWRL